MTNPQVFLQGLGLSSKEVHVYLALLQRGASSVRKLAEVSDVNRGTTYDILKSLQNQGLVSYYDQNKKAYFVAEDLQKLSRVLEGKESKVQELKNQLEQVVPQLQSLVANGSKTKPVARYFHGDKGVKSILLEVLEDTTALEEKKYHVYSSTAIAGYLYTSIPNFTELRIKSNIEVDVISLGDGGTINEKLSKRRWITKEESAPTYTIIFGRKTAFISLDDQNHPHGVIVEDKNLAQTQKILFLSLWNTLK